MTKEKDKLINDDDNDVDALERNPLINFREFFFNQVTVIIIIIAVG